MSLRTPSQRSSILKKQYVPQSFKAVANSTPVISIPKKPTLVKRAVSNQITTITYNDGSFFKGILQNDKRQGLGYYQFANGDVYEGNFQNDIIQGKGKYTFNENQLSYNGQFQNGVFNGQGILQDLTKPQNERQIYSGFWVAGKKEGYGVNTYSKNVYYKGEFKNNQKDGQGVFYDVNCTYNGLWKNNLKHGKGILQFFDGTTIQGVWNNDTITQGTVTYPNGAVYIGELNQYLQRDGKGKYIYTKGQNQFYNGKWKRDMKQDKEGTYYYKNNDYYQGGFSNNMKNGPGLYTMKNREDWLQGYFVNDVPVNGQIYKNGSKKHQFGEQR